MQVRIDADPGIDNDINTDGDTDTDSRHTHRLTATGDTEAHRFWNVRDTCTGKPIQLYLIYGFTYFVFKVFHFKNTSTFKFSIPVSPG